MSFTDDFQKAAHEASLKWDRLVEAAPEMLELLRKSAKKIDKLECMLDVGTLPAIGLRAMILDLIKRIDGEP